MSDTLQKKKTGQNILGLSEYLKMLAKRSQLGAGGTLLSRTREPNQNL